MALPSPPAVLHGILSAPPLSRGCMGNSAARTGTQSCSFMGEGPGWGYKDPLQDAPEATKCCLTYEPAVCRKPSRDENVSNVTTKLQCLLATSLPPKTFFRKSGCIAPASSWGQTSSNLHFQGFTASLPANSYSQMFLHFPLKQPECINLVPSQG